jgi:eukaryotic-like serine/threonine-protein kinase
MIDDESLPDRPAVADPWEAELTRAAVLRRLLASEDAAAPRIGRFTISSRIGQGGMGVVYLVHDEELDRPVALKIIRSDAGLEPAHLRREAQALARLSHPNVVQVYEVGQHESQVYIVMEYVPGETLREWSGDPSRTTEEIILAFVQAGKGLAAAHAAGLVHRDFKPDNAVVDEQGRVRVLDFGLARTRPTTMVSSGGDEGVRTPDSATSDPGVSTVRTAIGTPSYMAPEQFAGLPTDWRADQFAFCVALWEALCNERPFSGETPTELHARIRSGRIGKVPAGAKMPTWVLPLLRKGLAAAPTDRHASLDDLLDALERGVRPRKRRALVVLVGGAIVLAVVAGRVSASLSAAPCPDPAPALSTVWDEPVRQEVRAALLNAAPRFGEFTAARVELALDAWTAEWIDGHRDACAATHIRREQSEALLDARMRCLHARRDSLAATVGMLREADAGVAERAIEAVEALPAVSPCADLAYVQAVDPLPDDRSLAAIVSAQLEDVAHVRALRAVGRFDAAREAAARLLVIAEGIQHAPLVARAELLLGSALVELGSVLEAEPHLRRAYEVSRAAQLIDVAAEAASELGYLLGRHTTRRGEAKAWAAVAEVEASVLGNDRARASALNAYGVAAAQDGERDEARLAFQKAIALVEHESPSLAWLNFRSNLGRVTRMDGHLEEAVASLNDVVADARDLLGPEHPALVGFIDALVEPAMVLSQHERMEPLLASALRIATTSRGENHPDVARILSLYGSCKLALGELEEARSLLQRANATAVGASIRGAQQPQPALASLARVYVLLGEPDVAIEHLHENVRETDRFSSPASRSAAVARGELADVLIEIGRHEEATVLIEEATRVFEDLLGPDHLDVSGAMLVRAKAYAAAGRYDEALGDLERGLAIRAGVLGDDSHKLADLLIALADLHLDRDEAERALAVAERANTVLEGVPGVAPEFLAEGHFVLARALVGTARDRERATELAVRAREALQAGPPSARTRAEAVHVWLRSIPP